MKKHIVYHLNQASATKIADHLHACDSSFTPALSDRVQINDYASKIASNAMRFEAWSGDILVGMVAIYSDDQKYHTAYITSVSILQLWRGKGIADTLLKRSIEYAKVSGIKKMSLTVDGCNKRAVDLYKKSDFIADKIIGSEIIMSLYIK